MQFRWITQSNKTFIQLTSLNQTSLRRFGLAQFVNTGILLILLSLLASCAQLNSGLNSGHDGVLPVADNRHMPAVIKGLLEQADQQFLQGEYNESLATLERALRIKPRSPETWSRMAQVYLYQGKFPQTRQHAERSNSYIKDNEGLKYFNNKLIQTAREGIQP